MLIWVFALTVAYPYVPGSDSPAFKGISVLLGLMESLGSAGLVNQLMSGLVVAYSHALKIGEYVRVGQTEGTVSDVGMLSTKLGLGEPLGGAVGVLALGVVVEAPKQCRVQRRWRGWPDPCRPGPQGTSCPAPSRLPLSARD